MNEPNDPAIGGYFQLELPAERPFPFPLTATFQSARAAFRALIRAGQPTKIWMPKYICNAMLSPLQAEHVEVAWYDVNDRFEVEQIRRIGDEDWFLYVNYFGVCGNQIAALMERIPPRQLVLDCSQAFFAPPVNDVLATIYSPRKFFGVPDGGLLTTRVPVPFPSTQDNSSYDRVSHLIKRLGDSPEAGYSDFQCAEKSLDDFEPRRLSRLTQRILYSIDFARSCQQRTENFQFLHRELASDNRLSLNLSDVSGAMSYPFLTNDVALRRRLIENRIFTPTYWPDAVTRLNADWAEKMVQNLLPLPVDQRYGLQEMERIVAVIHGQQS